MYDYSEESCVFETHDKSYLIYVDTVLEWIKIRLFMLFIKCGDNWTRQV